MSNCRVSWALLAPLLLILGALPSAAADPEGPSPVEIDVPVGLPIQIDGRIVDAEWEGAESRVIAKDGSSLRIMQRSGTLFLGLTSPTRWAERASIWFSFTPDTEGAGLYSKSAVRLDFEPREHNRPHLYVVRNDGDGDVPVQGEAVARAELTPTSSSVEVALRLSLIGVTAEPAPPVRFAIVWTRGGGSPAVTWPRGLRITAPVGQRPADLASSRRWARLGGWTEAGGSGAISRTDWDALVAADAELTRRGSEAHALALRIQETPALPKQDDVVEETVLQNLRWIAEREPLTAFDLFNLARVYRHLNRKAEGLAVLDALDTLPTWRSSARLLYDRALALESAERYGEAAEAWRALAGRSQPSMRPRYEAMAARAVDRQAAREREALLRAEAAANPTLPLILLRTTRGSVLIQLLPDTVPEAVAHFLDLVDRREGDEEGGFYDGTLFHRVEGDFLVQGGDPLSREGVERAGSGTGPTSVTAELNPSHGYFRGAVAFARSIARVNGSQFFILTSPRPALAEEGYTIFGHVLAGMDVVDRIQVGDELIEARRLDGGASTPPIGHEGETSK